MKITIDKQPVCKAEFNFEKFREEFTTTFNIRKSILNSISIKEKAINYEISEIKKMLYFNTDWENVLFLNNVRKRKKMTLKLFRCNVERFTVYNPDYIDPVSRTVKMVDEKIDKTDFLVTNDLNLRIDKHIEYMLGQSLIDYVNIDWKMMLNFEAKDL